MSGGQALAVGNLRQLRKYSGLKSRRQVRQLPTLQDVYLAIVDNHNGEGRLELAETRTA
jgi:hypothetical protein